MFIPWLIFHILVSFGLILVVLLQSSKGEGLAGSAFGGGGGGGMGGAMFGGRGAASFLSNATTVLAILFMVNCGALAFMSANSTKLTQTTAPDGTATSVVTQKAQAERDRTLQQQAQQQAAQAADSGFNIEVIQGGGAEVTPTPVDTSGQ